jgi:CopG family transcriptional regulator, nickel-responsive regulator
MQRVTVVLDDELLDGIDRFAEARGYANRSEALRDLARRGLQQASEEGGGDGDCVAALTYAYDFSQRDLAKRLANALSERHDLVVASLQVHLDHTSRLEVSVLRGPSKAVSQLGDQVIAERGVRHGRLVMAPVEVTRERHAHQGEAPHEHLHVRVKGAG